MRLPTCGWNLTGCAVTCMLLLAATDSDAQRRGRGQWQRGGSQPMAGIRGGYDYDVERWSAGGQIRIPLGWRGLQVIPSGDVFFLHRDTAWQGNVDVALRGRRGRMYAGGGLAITNMYGDGDDSKARIGYNLLVGSPLPVGGLPFRMYLEARWTYVNDRSPFRVVIGLNWPLGRRRPSIF